MVYVKSTNILEKKPMLLAIDAGNTNTVFAVFDGAKLLGQWRISTDANRTADEYAIWLLLMLDFNRISPEAIDAAICACVVPSALFDLKSLVKRYFGAELLVIGEGGVETGIQALVENPQEVGADRLVNAYAAWMKAKSALVVVDFGTATTFDVVSAQGQYIGGVIAPGVNLSLDALQKAAAKLPTVAITHPSFAIGKNTVSAMQSGIYYGYIGLIEGIVKRIREEMKAPLKVIATGGLSSLYAEACPMIEEVAPDLTLWGLREIHTLNQSRIFTV